MTVEIHIPTINEVTQAVYNLGATKHLLEWHDWLTSYCEPIMYVGFVEHNPLAHAPRPLDILDQPGDLVLDDVPIPFELIPPDDGIYYMVKTEEINGKKYSFFRPCHPSEKPEEGERLERYEKPLRLPPHAQIEEGVLTTLATAYGIRKELQEGSFEQPTVTQHGWGPANFQFKF